MKDRDLTNIWESYRQSRTEQTSEEVLSEAHCMGKKKVKEAHCMGKKKVKEAHCAGKKKVKEAAKPDYIDIDGDGNKKEPMKKAVADKKAMTDGDPDTHPCATKVKHESFGIGTPIHARHAEPDENGHVSWYAVMFEHGTEVVDTVDMDILDESNHGSHKK